MFVCFLWLFTRSKSINKFVEEKTNCFLLIIQVLCDKRRIKGPISKFDEINVWHHSSLSLRKEAFFWKMNKLLQSEEVLSSFRRSRALEITPLWCHKAQCYTHISTLASETLVSLHSHLDLPLQKERKEFSRKFELNQSKTCCYNCVLKQLRTWQQPLSRCYSGLLLEVIK